MDPGEWSIAKRKRMESSLRSDSDVLVCHHDQVAFKRYAATRGEALQIAMTVKKSGGDKKRAEARHLQIQDRKSVV